jgi:phosphoglycolate phosphatase-like HAD superfamily hydrolase
MRALVLDFDGVIADTAPECFEVALRTWADLRPDADLGRFDRATLYRGFLALMPLGNRAEDFGVALAALYGGAKLPDQKSYDAFHDARPAGWLPAFHRRFYEHRAEFARTDPTGWRALMAPYADFLVALRRNEKRAQLAIATAKDRASVIALLTDWHVRDLFRDELIVDKEIGESKVIHLQHLQSVLGFPFAEFTFVDDKVNHLESVSPLGVRCGLAAWGYNGPREQTAARARGYLVCTLGDAERLLFGP